MMFAGRDRFAHRREFDESRDLYYNSQNLLRINRSSKEDAKTWPRKYEERVYPISNEHQKYRPRTPIDDHGYRSYDHPHHRYQEHRYKSRSRSPPLPWPPHHRRDYSVERKHDRRKEDDNKANVPALRNKTMKPLEHSLIYSSTRYSTECPKEKNHLSVKPKSDMLHDSKWKSSSRKSKSRSKVSYSKAQSIQKKQNTKEALRRSPMKKKTFSHVSSSDFKSSPSTEHLEKQKKYLVDRLAEYENMRQASPENIPDSKPKSPPKLGDIEKEDVKTNNTPPNRSPLHPPVSPTSSSLHSFDCKGEGIHYNINFPTQVEDEDDYAEEAYKTFEPLGHPEFVTVSRPSDFRPFFIREEFKRNKGEVWKEEDKLLIREFRKNGLKRDSVDNKKFHVAQVVNVPKNALNTLKDQNFELGCEPLPDTRSSNLSLSNRVPIRRTSNNQKVLGGGFDLRQRIHERLQKRQVCNQTGAEPPKPFPPAVEHDSPEAPEQEFDHEDHLIIKPPIRRVVNNSRSIALVRTFSNGTMQPRRSVVITRSRPTKRLLQ